MSIPGKWSSNFTLFELKLQPCEIRFPSVLAFSLSPPPPPFFIYFFHLITSEGKVSVCTDSPSSLRPSVCLSARLFMVNFNVGLFLKKKQTCETRNLSLWLAEALISFQFFIFFVSESTCTHHPWCTRLAAAGWIACFYDPRSYAGRSLSLCSWQVQPSRTGPWRRGQRKHAYRSSRLGGLAQG